MTIYTIIIFFMMNAGNAYQRSGDYSYCGSLSDSGSDDWAGAVLTPNEKIYEIPANLRNALESIQCLMAPGLVICNCLLILMTHPAQKGYNCWNL